MISETHSHLDALHIVGRILHNLHLVILAVSVTEIVLNSSSDYYDYNHLPPMHRIWCKISANFTSFCNPNRAVL